MTTFCVLWRCFNPRPLAVFSSREDAELYIRTFKFEVDTLLSNIGLTGNEVFEIHEIQFNPIIERV